MGEGGVGGEVFIDRIFLFLGGALGEEMHHGGDFLDRVVHNVFVATGFDQS